MRLILAALALACAPMAFAQQHEQVPCATDASLPAELANWSGETAIATGADAAAATAIQVGKGYEARLGKKAEVTFAIEPERPGGSVSYSGIFAFDAPEAGNYAVALGSAAWIDVVEDGKALEPLSFGHGPRCTTIRKKVVYSLKAGRHILQIAGNGAETAKVLVTRLP